MYRLENHVWNFGTYPDIETAEKVAMMFIKDHGHQSLMIKDADTDKLIETVATAEQVKKTVGKCDSVLYYHTKG